MHSGWMRWHTLLKAEEGRIGFSPSVMQHEQLFEEMLWLTSCVSLEPSRLLVVNDEGE